MNQKWFKYGFWNTFEHSITRFSDAFTTLFLLWKLSPEVFSKLALAQAVVAPMLLFFISPETVIYRDFSIWKREGAKSLSARMQVFRRFSWGKFAVAIVIAVLMAAVVPGSTGFLNQLWALLWAFFLYLAPQLSGVDREFLRLELELEKLSSLSFLQKASFLGGTILVATLYPGTLAPLALVAGVSAVSSGLLARSWAIQRLRKLENEETPVPGASSGVKHGVAVLLESLKTFSLWGHVGGVLLSWVQTMDVFFLGLFRFPAREVGLYAATLKLGNFAMLLPTAFSNLFSIWVGRRVSNQDGRELKELKRGTLLLFLALVVQACVIYALAPWVFQFLSHGRWSDQEIAQMISWLKWILAGTTAMTSSYLIGSWLSIRLDVRSFFFRAVLPWTVVSAAIYGALIGYGGIDYAAKANLPVGVCYFMAVFLYFYLFRVRHLRQAHQ